MSTYVELSERIMQIGMAVRHAKLSADDCKALKRQLTGVWTLVQDRQHEEARRELAAERGQG